MSDRGGHTFLAFVLGGIVGAGLALLYAPTSGEEARRRIKDGVEGAGDWAYDRYSDTRDRLSDSTERVKQFAGDRKDDLRTAYEAGKDAYQKGKEKLLKETGGA